MVENRLRGNLMVHMRLVGTELALILWLGLILAPCAAIAESGSVELLRDRWGIPNVFADTDEGAMFALGWAAAEDRAFQMYLHARMVQGRCAEVRGVVASEINGRTSIEMDRRNRTLGLFPSARAIAANLDEETRRMLEAYAAGVNAYIQAHPDRLSPMFVRTGLVPEPWTPAHCIAIVWNFAFHFTDDGFKDLHTLHRYEQAGDTRMTSGRASTAIDYGATIQREDVSDAWVRKSWEYVRAKGVKPERATQAPTPKMSHAWVVGKARSSTGAAILHSDPQMAVCNPSQFYSFHVCGGTFNVRGAGVAGSPWILIGINQHVAWGMTGLPIDAADLFLLKTDHDRPNQYEFDGQWHDMEVSSETILVRDAEPVVFERRHTHLGPVVTPLVADAREGEEVVLVAVPLCVKDRETVEACLPMFRAKNVAQLDAAMEQWMFPPANMVMGDAEGNIAYRSLGALPLRSPHSRWEGRTAQRGWKSEHLWQEFVPHELMPHCTNPQRGYLASANQRPIASFYPIPSGFTFGGFGGRGRRLYERMEMRDRFTPEDVLDVHYDMVNVVKRDVVRLGFHIRGRMKAPLSDSASRALVHLETWHEAGWKMDNRIPGTALVKVMPWKLDRQLDTLIKSYDSDEYRSAGSDLGIWFDMVFARLAKDPAAPLSNAECKFIDTALADTWNKALTAYGHSPSDWQRIAIEQYRRRKLQYYQDLAGYPSLETAYDLPEPDLRDNEQLTLLSQRGQAYSQSVSLHDPDAALALEPIGASEHPASPYRLSTYQLWAEGKFHPAPLSQTSVDKFLTYRLDLSEDYARVRAVVGR